jgi:hypothetical protein
MTRLTQHPMRRLPGLAVLAAALAVPVNAHAATGPPVVRAAVGEHSITLTGTHELGRGPVRLRLSGAALTRPRSVAVLELRRGVTRSDVEHADLSGLDNAHAAERLGRLVAGGEVSNDAGHDTIIVARAREHVVVDVTNEQGATAAFRVARRPNGARLPAADARVALRDDSLRVPAQLPGRGLLRIANEGRLPHALTAFRLKRGISPADAVRAARHGGRLDRIGEPTALTGLVSRGTVNRVAVTLRRGRYLLASLHAPLVHGGRPDILRGLLGTTRVR